MALEALHRGGVDLAVYGLSPDRAARHSDYCDLGPHAARLGLPFASIVDLSEDATMRALVDFEPDVICVFGWSRLIGPEVLRIPRVGVLGWHPSLLPENRGRGVIPWTILQRRAESALTVFWIDAGMDSGDIAVQVPFAVAPSETATSLYGKIETAATSAVEELLGRGPPDHWPRRPQDHGKATWCARRTFEDGRIDWTRAADDVWTLIRASTRPYPGAHSKFGGAGVSIWAAELVREHRHWAAPGQIVEFREEGPLVQCGDRGAVLLTDLSLQDGAPITSLRLHERFDY